MSVEWPATMQRIQEIIDERIDYLRSEIKTLEIEQVAIPKRIITYRLEIETLTRMKTPGAP